MGPYEIAALEKEGAKLKRRDEKWKDRFSAAQIVQSRLHSKRREEFVAQLPPELLESEKDCGTFVYFAKCGRNVKIGFAKDVKARCKSFQTALSETLHIICAVRGGRKLERYFHEMFKAERLKGEWFTYHDKIKCFLDATPYVESEHEWRL